MTMSSANCGESFDDAMVRGSSSRMSDSSFTSSTCFHNIHESAENKRTVDILNFDYLERVLLPNKNRPANSLQEELAALAPNPIAPGLSRDDFDSIRLGIDSFQTAPRQGLSQDASIRFEQQTIMPHLSFPPGANTCTSQQSGAFHSAMSCSTSLNDSNASLQQLSPQSRHSSMPCALNNSNDPSLQQQVATQCYQSRLAPQPPVLGTASALQNPSPNLSNSLLPPPAYSGNNDNNSSSLHHFNSVEYHPEYAAAAERLSRSMQRSMTSRMSVKHQGGIAQGFPTFKSEGDDMANLLKMQEEEFFRLLQQEGEVYASNMQNRTV